MSWEWGGGWLDSLGFADFAGSTLVHACGGAAALAGVMILGPVLEDLLMMVVPKIWHLLLLHQFHW